MHHYIHPNACLQHWQPSHCALQIWCLCQWSRIQCKLDWSPGRWVGIIKYSFYSSACFFRMQHQSFGFCSLIIDFVAGCNILQKCSCCSLNWIEVVTTATVFDCWQFTTCYLSAILNYKAVRVYVYIQYSVGFNKLSFFLQAVEAQSQHLQGKSILLCIPTAIQTMWIVPGSSAWIPTTVSFWTSQTWTLNITAAVTLTMWL